MTGTDAWTGLMLVRLQWLLAPDQDDACVHDLCGQMRGEPLRIMGRTDRVDVEGHEAEPQQSL